MKLPVIKHLTQFIEENDEDFVVETIETLESLTEVSSLKDEELDVIGELISNMYGAIEVNILQTLHLRFQYNQAVFGHYESGRQEPQKRWKEERRAESAHDDRCPQRYAQVCKNQRSQTARQKLFAIPKPCSPQYDCL